MCALTEANQMTQIRGERKMLCAKKPVPRDTKWESDHPQNQTGLHKIQGTHKRQTI